MERKRQKNEESSINEFWEASIYSKQDMKHLQMKTRNTNKIRDKV